MYSKQESQQIKKQFWIAFAEKYPRKWILYDTKIKDLVFKFQVDNKSASIIIEIASKPEEKRIAYYEKFESFKNILFEDYQLELIYEKNYYLESKTISQIWLEKPNVSLHNQSHWEEIFDFFYINMNSLELFYFEYSDIIKSV